MNSDPLTNHQLTHDEAVRRFLERLNADSQPKQHQAKIWRRATDQLVTQEAAEELARWFKK